MSTRKPLIGIPADRRLLGDHYFHCVGEKYIRAVAEGAAAVPVLIPSLGDAVDTREVLSDFDAILLTGSVSNGEPHQYGGPASAPDTLHNAHRDATTLPMIPREARAPDGVIEAFSVRNAGGFALAVPWHPEWGFSENPFSSALFAAFGQAARERALRHRV